MNPHYHALAGLYKGIPNYVGDHQTFEDAVEDLVALYKLGSHRAGFLRREDYLDLILERDGNEYCEVVECYETDCLPRGGQDNMRYFHRIFSLLLDQPIEGLLKWIYPGWYVYLFDDSHADKVYGPYCHWKSPFHRFGNWVSRIGCRARGHSAGVYYCNPGGLEPDMRCKGCGEDLG